MFVCKFQYAHHEIDECETRGPIGPEDFPKVFDDFPWKNQVAEANKLQKCSPTISVENQDGNILWVSAYEQEGQLEYIVASVREVERSLLGIIKWRAKEYRQTITRNTDEVRRLFSLFFANDWRALLASLAD